MAEGKELHQCILILHALTSILVPPDLLDLPQDELRRLQQQGAGGVSVAGAGAAGLGTGVMVSSSNLFEMGHDGLAFVVPVVLAAVRRHRGQTLRWLTLKGPTLQPSGTTAAFARTLRIRRAFVRSGALERVLAVLEQCIGKFEAQEWKIEVRLMLRSIGAFLIVCCPKNLMFQNLTCTSTAAMHK